MTRRTSAEIAHEAARLWAELGASEAEALELGACRVWPRHDLLRNASTAQAKRLDELSQELARRAGEPEP